MGWTRQSGEAGDGNQLGGGRLGADRENTAQVTERGKGMKVEARGGKEEGKKRGKKERRKAFGVKSRWDQVAERRTQVEQDREGGCGGPTGAARRPGQEREQRQYPESVPQAFHVPNRSIL